MIAIFQTATIIFVFIPGIMRSYMFSTYSSKKNHKNSWDYLSEIISFSTLIYSISFVIFIIYDFIFFSKFKGLDLLGLALRAEDSDKILISIFTLLIVSFFAFIWITLELKRENSGQSGPMSKLTNSENTINNTTLETFFDLHVKYRNREIVDKLSFVQILDLKERILYEGLINSIPLSDQDERYERTIPLLLENTYAYKMSDDCTEITEDLYESQYLTLGFNPEHMTIRIEGESDLDD